MGMNKAELVENILEAWEAWDSAFQHILDQFIFVQTHQHQLLPIVRRQKKRSSSPDCSNLRGGRYVFSVAPMVYW